jgi:competence protein ComEA
VGRADRASGWLQDRLPTRLQGRVALGARELVLLVLVAAVGLAVAAVVVLRSGSGRDPVTLAGDDSGSPGALLSIAPTGAGPATSVAAGSPAPGSAGTGATAATGGSVTVDVSGRVRRPGVVTLPAGSRVIDALRRAGGPRGRVDLTSLNLARVLADGEQIVVGRPTVGVAASAAGTPGAPPGGPLVNINTAGPTELEELPGVGPVTAQKILAWRSAHGTFSSVDELLEVDGIGEKTLADMAPYVTL